jgi:hypothetical protein
MKVKKLSQLPIFMQIIFDGFTFLMATAFGKNAPKYGAQYKSCSQKKQ